MLVVNVCVAQVLPVVVDGVPPLEPMSPLVRRFPGRPLLSARMAYLTTPPVAAASPFRTYEDIELMVTATGNTMSIAYSMPSLCGVAGTLALPFISTNQSLATGLISGALGVMAASTTLLLLLIAVPLMVELALTILLAAVVLGVLPEVVTAPSKPSVALMVVPLLVIGEVTAITPDGP